jgi:N-acetylglucosamine malate deacetylase 1
MSRVLVISPHPDDESIGCGGTLRGHVLAGDPVQVIYLTSGEAGGHGRTAEETACLREQEASAAAAILGFDEFEFWREPDGRFQATHSAVQRLRQMVKAWRPDILYVTHDKEMHPDHRAAARMVRHCLAGRLSRVAKPLVLMYEVWTPLQRMDRVVDISQHLDVKIKAIRAHKTQCAVIRLDEASRALSRYRGEMHSWPGGDYAEIFAEMHR